ncbi:CBS domain-containing protein [bacterium]|nr:CBS domain-containing protein [bacterium]
MIARRYAEGSAITVRPEDTLIQAYRRMKIDDVSQVPVMEDDKLTGIIDESDILLAVHADAAKFNAPVREHMVTTLDTVPVDADIDDLLPIFAKDRVAIVEDDTGFIGLITRIDVLNYLRQRVQ